MIIMVEWTPKLVTIYKNVVKNADLNQELTLLLYLVKQNKNIIHIKYHMYQFGCEILCPAPVKKCSEVFISYLVLITAEWIPELATLY